MGFVIIGIAIIVMNLAGIGPFALWNWDFTGDLWKFCVPFAFAIAWWTWSDVSGLNKRREMEKMDAKKKARREENLTALGLGGRKKR
ncbi:MAG TPA: TIGR04438 family Trp-rich protein [Burkholderiaceae bacterium]|jgi:small Trp-rich protein